MEWPAQPFWIFSLCNINQKITAPEGTCLGTWCSVQMGWEQMRSGREVESSYSFAREISGIREGPQVVLMESTRYNTTPKPPLAQRCASTIVLLSYNFHCLWRKEKLKCCAFIWNEGLTVSSLCLCWFCLMKWLRHHVTGIAGVGGKKTSLRIGTEDLWLALENNGWYSLWILQENLTEKDVFHLCPFLLFLAALQMIWNGWAYQ